MAFKIKSNVGRVGATNRATVVAGQAGAKALAQGAQAVGQIGGALDAKETADANQVKRAENEAQRQRLRENNYRRSEILNDYGAQKNSFMRQEQDLKGKDAEGGVQRFEEFQLAYNQKLKITDPDLKRQIANDFAADSNASTNGIQMRENGILRGVRKEEIQVRKNTHRENIVTQANNIDWTIASNTFVDDLLVDSLSTNEDIQGALALENGTSLELAAQQADADSHEDRVIVYNSLLKNISSNVNDPEAITGVKTEKLNAIIENDESLTDTDKQTLRTSIEDINDAKRAETIAFEKAQVQKQKLASNQARVDLGRQLGQIPQGPQRDAQAKQLMLVNPDPEFRKWVKSAIKNLEVDPTPLEINTLRSSILIPDGSKVKQSEEDVINGLNKMFNAGEIDLTTRDEMVKLAGDEYDSSKKELMTNLQSNLLRTQATLGADKKATDERRALNSTVNSFIRTTLTPALQDKNVTLKEMNTLTTEFWDGVNGDLSKENMSALMLRSSDTLNKFRAPGDQVEVRKKALESADDPLNKAIIELNKATRDLSNDELRALLR